MSLFMMKVYTQLTSGNLAALEWVSQPDGTSVCIWNQSLLPLVVLSSKFFRKDKEYRLNSTHYVKYTRMSKPFWIFRSVIEMQKAALNIWDYNNLIHVVFLSC